ncbi:DNA repair protein RadA [uncultured Megasphaera sp.]|uniref:DNA repair protein RadA n=1 Tax=uncultured Megasphaera sp. TaxID=165188 RepID=UPI00259A3DE4|nr:DNA repair protein RadA [uncultured Megasphaera sp.]
MAKSKTQYVCKACGSISSRWLGKCPQCGAWNTLIEQTVTPAATSTNRRRKRQGEAAAPTVLSAIAMEATSRLETHIGELDRVLGGGLVRGSIVLLSGDPGIGKSTLVLQLAAAIGKQGYAVLYGSGEESAAQIKMRAQRLGITGTEIIVQAETSLENILREAGTRRPALVIIDSIQTMFCGESDGTPGSLAQIRECTGTLLTFAKSEGITVLIIGHVTKDGNIAGPRVLEHMVDTVLYFEGEKNYQFRVLRSIKNRFGSTRESGLFTMKAGGLAELTNPSRLFLAERTAAPAGSAIVAVMDGMRPLLTEIQALTTRSVFPVPRRTASGMDYNRLLILLAVLEKRAGLQFNTQDVYINIVGGLKISETAADLAVAAAIFSGMQDRPLDGRLLVLGEVGLTGDIRRVSHAARRVREGVKLGFNACILPYGNREEVQGENITGCHLYYVKTLREALETAFSFGNKN